MNSDLGGNLLNSTKITVLKQPTFGRLQTSFNSAVSGLTHKQLHGSQRTGLSVGSQLGWRFGQHKCSVFSL